MFKTLLSRGGFSIDRLHNFVLVAEAKGIARAIGDDPVRQSLVSRQIKELEEFFEVKLIKRSGKGLDLTEQGKLLAQLAREHFMALDDFAQQCGKQECCFTIGAGNSILEWLLLPKISEMNKIFENSNIELSNLKTEEVVQKLTDLSLDIGIMRKSAIQYPLKGLSLGEMRFKLYAPKDLISNNPSTNSQIPLATYQGGVFAETLARDLKHSKRTIRIALSCTSYTQALKAMESGDYGAILPAIAEPMIDKTKFTSLNVPFLREHKRELCLAWNPRLLKIKTILSRHMQDLQRALRLTAS